MRKLKRLIGLALMASAASVATAGVASAEGTVSGTLTLTSDYVFRGISQTSGSPAIQGSFDYSSGSFYAGVWGSNVNFPGSDETLEMDVYAGFKPTLGPVSLDLGVIGYFYPGAEDAGAEFDYTEFKAAGTINPVEPLTLGLSVFYSPEFFGETGEAIYYEGSAAFALTETIGLKATYGVQDVDDYGDTYSNWSIGATYATHGFTLGLAYTDTEDAYDVGYAVDETDADGGFVFSVGRAF
jgi:uncharacterized protein (TIGR02001 family)